MEGEGSEGEREGKGVREGGKVEGGGGREVAPPPSLLILPPLSLTRPHAPPPPVSASVQLTLAFASLLSHNPPR